MNFRALLHPKLTTQWLLLLAVTLLPPLLLLPAGLYWLWQADLLLAWLLLAGLVTLSGWLLARRLRREAIPPTVTLDPSTYWNDQGSAAWAKIEAYAAEQRQQEPALEQWEFYWVTLREVLQRVAAHYHPEQRDPILELKAPDLLKVIELLARDLRLTFSDNIPGSHILTVNQVVRGHRLLGVGQELYRLYRIVSFGIDPLAAAARELRGLAYGNLLEDSARDFKFWLVDAYIKKIGYYAIELYSGRLVLDENALAHHVTTASAHDAQTAQEQTAKLTEEPLRILVLGQVKAGKSSLINALFGEMKALTDVVPATSGITPYLLTRDGLERAIILDTAGYADSDNPLKPLRAAEQEILRSDLVLFVSPANSAARAQDRQLLEGLLALFRQHTQETPPPVIVVLSQIDRLRPVREWQPPYNIATPDTPKAQTIRQAMETVATDLNVPLERVVPVVLKPERLYNLEEGLLPAILHALSAAQRVRYLRCLADYHHWERWQQLWQQSLNAGRFIVDKGLEWLNRNERPPL